MKEVITSRILRTIPLLIAVCIVSIPAQAQYGGGSGTTASAETNTYVFLPGQSTVVQTGGFAGVHETYPVEGQFRLTVDFDTGTALFSQVDANLVDESPFLPTESLGELFNMAELLGTVVDDTIIDFVGKTADGMESDILLTLTFRDDSAHLAGGTVPPPGADFFVFELDAVASMKYGGGTGEPNDPYQIATAEELMLLGDSPEDYDKHFILTDDIDLDPNLPGGQIFTRPVIAPCEGARFPLRGEPTFPTGTTFTGSFNGNGYTVNNLTLDDEGKKIHLLGLFGVIDSMGRVENLGIENASIKADMSYYIGILAGYSWGQIVKCYATGRITGRSSLGGLVGINERIITRCLADVSVINTEASSVLGGLVGRNGRSGTISYCCATGSVSGDDNVGGLVGMNLSKIDDCYATGSVSGTADVGGLVGVSSGTITNCYSIASVSGGDTVGGLVGDLYYGTITNCYSNGRVSGNDRVGGLVGLKYGTVKDSFWDIQTSGQVTSAGGTGKTTAEMQTESTFTDAGWDFVGESLNGTEDIWRILEGQDYPRLWWQFFVVDDFESYNDFEPDRIFDIWIDGWGDPENRSVVGYADPNFLAGEHHIETTIVHGGEQSMPYFYYNAGPVNYSEATVNIANLVIGRDWTKYGATVLSMWFYGDPANFPEPMYVAIANYNGPTAVVYHDNPDAALIGTWTEWTIPLTEFSNQGVDLTDVDTISIGFGDKNPDVSGQPGGSGLVFFDDIRLYRPPELEPVQSMKPTLKSLLRTGWQLAMISG